MSFCVVEALFLSHARPKRKCLSYLSIIREICHISTFVLVIAIRYDKHPLFAPALYKNKHSTTRRKHYFFGLRAMLFFWIIFANSFHKRRLYDNLMRPKLHFPSQIGKWWVTLNRSFISWNELSSKNSLKWVENSEITKLIFMSSRCAAFNFFHLEWR